MNMPMWLEQIPYEMPGDLPYRPDRILLFKTKFTTPEADTLYETGLDEFAAGHAEVAEQKLDAALKLVPNSAEFWVAKANLQVNRSDLSGAYKSVVAALRNATAPQQFIICNGEAGRFYERHAPRVAVELYRAAIGIYKDPTAMNNLAWLLATSSDDQVRNGKEALALVEPLVKSAPQPAVFNAYAAALAECGRFADAVVAGTNAIEAAKKTGNAQMVTNAEARLARYRENKPWRE
jgi:tetratricopeptide (TPR) repeat protein